VRLKTLPLSPALRRYAATGGGAPEQIALTGGEDYELLFTTAKPLESWEGAVARATENDRCALHESVP
jgi:thiamine-monophosphate kinase